LLDDPNVALVVPHFQWHVSTFGIGCVMELYDRARNLPRKLVIRKNWC
jgi:hypothetical protein